MRRFLPPLLAVAVVAACGGGGDSDSSGTSLYKYLGSVQCTGGGTSLSSIERQLIDAGVQVVAAACGIDGNPYLTVCGAPDGRIAIFDIPAAQAPFATALGFVLLSNLPSAAKVACGP